VNLDGKVPILATGGGEPTALRERLPLPRGRRTF
jgi:hypothetical protein